MVPMVPMVQVAHAACDFLCEIGEPSEFHLHYAIGSFKGQRKRIFTKDSLAWCSDLFQTAMVTVISLHPKAYQVYGDAQQIQCASFHKRTSMREPPQASVKCKAYIASQ